MDFVNGKFKINASIMKHFKGHVTNPENTIICLKES